MEELTWAARGATDRIFFAGRQRIEEAEGRHEAIVMTAVEMAIEKFRAGGGRGSEVGGEDWACGITASQNSHPFVHIKNTESLYTKLVSSLIQQCLNQLLAIDFSSAILDSPKRHSYTASGVPQPDIRQDDKTQQSHHAKLSHCHNVQATVGTAPSFKGSRRCNSNPEDLFREEIQTEEDLILRLLVCLIRVKESTGQCRTFLAFLLSLPDRSLLDGPVPEGVTYGDLIVRIEAQMTHMKLLQDCIASLDRQKSYMPHQRRGMWDGIRMLVEESLATDEGLVKNVQERVMENYDLKGVRETTSLTEYWHCATIYMDCLHSLELFLIAEIEGLMSSNACESTDASLDFNMMLIQGALASSDTEAGMYYDQSDCEALENIFRESFSPLKMALPVYLNNIPNDTITNFPFPSNANLYQIINSMPAEIVKDAVQSIFSTNNIHDEKLLHPLFNNTNKLFTDGNKIDDSFSLTTSGLPQRSSSFKKLNTFNDIDLYELHFIKRIGRGSGGTTYLGRWAGQNVAIKVAAMNDVGLDGWSKEVTALQHIHHPNVIRLLGSIQNEYPPTYCLVLEYCDAGDLSSALTCPTPPKFFEKIMTSVVAGMKYLHQHHFIHSDLKPANILLHGNVKKGNFLVKVSDFGNSVKKFAEESVHAEEHGTLRWRAPELIRHEKFGEKADVYSFGLIMWQLITREIPFADQSPLVAAGKVAYQKIRPPFPADTPDVISAYIEKCWHELSNSRPSFTDIETFLLDFNRKYSSCEMWLDSPTGHSVYSVTKNASNNSQLLELEEVSSENREEIVDFESALAAVRKARKSRKKNKKWKIFSRRGQ